MTLRSKFGVFILLLASCIGVAAYFNFDFLNLKNNFINTSVESKITKGDIRISLNIHPNLSELWKKTESAQFYLYLRLIPKEWNYVLFPKRNLIFSSKFSPKSTQEIIIPALDYMRLGIKSDQILEISAIICLNKFRCENAQSSALFGRIYIKSGAPQQIKLNINKSSIKGSQKSENYFEAVLNYDPVKLKSSSNNWYFLLYESRDPNLNSVGLKTGGAVNILPSAVAIAGPLPLTVNAVNISIKKEQTLTSNYTGRLAALLFSCDDPDGDLAKCAILARVTKSSTHPPYMLLNSNTNGLFPYTGDNSLEIDGDN